MYQYRLWHAAPRYVMMMHALERVPLGQWVIPLTPPPSPRGLWPKATGEWQSLCTVLASLELCNIEWQLSFLVLQKHGRVIAEMMPKVVLVKALEVVGTHSVWKHPSRRVGARRARGGRHGGARPEVPQSAPNAPIVDEQVGPTEIEGMVAGAASSGGGGEAIGVPDPTRDESGEASSSDTSGGSVSSDQALSDADSPDSAPEEGRGVDVELDRPNLSDDDIEGADMDQISDGIPEEPDEGEAAAPPPRAASASAASGANSAPDIRDERPGNAAIAPQEGGIGRDVVFHLPGGSGRIAYYPRIQRFEATCPAWESHGRRCRLTRTARPASDANLLRNPFQGRCLGLLAAWCAQHDQPTARDHLSFRPTRSARQTARRELMALDPNLATELENAERPREEDEDTEPDFIM